jgi:hypothetical protein
VSLHLEAPPQGLVVGEGGGVGPAAEVHGEGGELLRGAEEEY